MRGVSSWLLQLPTPPIHHVSYLASQQLTRAYETQTQIGWDHFLKGRLSIEWSALMRFEYSKLSSLPTLPGKKPKYRTPESWAKGIITLNWEFVNQLWEQRIASVQTNNHNLDTRNNHYFLVQKAYHMLQNHRITNTQDKLWLLKSHEVINKMSTNQLRL